MSDHFESRPLIVSATLSAMLNISESLARRNKKLNENKKTWSTDFTKLKIQLIAINLLFKFKFSSSYSCPNEYRRHDANFCSVTKLPWCFALLQPAYCCSISTNILLLFTVHVLWHAVLQMKWKKNNTNLPILVKEKIY